MFAGVMAALSTVIYLRISQTLGRLSQDLTYDDIGYINDAVERISVGYKYGVIYFIKTFADNPPHSPFSTLLACLALVFGGYHDSAVYISNGILLVAAAVFLVWLFKDSGPGAVVWIVTFFLSSPLAYRAIHDFRPDIALGFATTVMTCLFALALIKDNGRYFMAAGIAFGACLLIKPTFFAHTLAMGAGLVALHLFIGSRWATWVSSRIDIPRRIESMRFLLAGFALALPYYAFNAREIFNYFWSNTRGDTSSIWSYSSDTSLFLVTKEFLLGSDNIVAYKLAGFHAVLSVLCIVCGLGLMLYRQNRKELLKILTLVLAALASFGIIIIGRHKNDFFLASFYSLMFLAGFVSFAYLSREAGNTARRMLLAVAWLALVATLYGNRSLVHWQPAVEASARNSWNSKVVEAIASDLPHHEFTPSEKVKLFVAMAGPVSAETLKWTATKHGVSIQPFDRHISGDIQEFINAAGEAAYILVPNEVTSEYFRWLPSAKVQSRLLTFLRTDPRFRQIQFFSLDDHYYLFTNRDVCAPIIDIDGLMTHAGFGPVEGPYPQWDLPRVRWMNEAEARLCFNVSAPGRYAATIRFRPEADGSLSITEQNGKLIRVETFKASVFTAATFMFSVPAGQQCLNLSARMGKLPDEKRQLLFTTIRVVKQP